MNKKFLFLALGVVALATIFGMQNVSAYYGEHGGYSYKSYDSDFYGSSSYSERYDPYNGQHSVSIRRTARNAYYVPTSHGSLNRYGSNFNNRYRSYSNPTYYGYNYPRYHVSYGGHSYGNVYYNSATDYWRYGYQPRQVSVVRYNYWD